MRIPLDYYRILGLPIQASVEQLQQAHRDRNMQLPRQEYSQAAIVARKQLIEAANAVLSDPEQRTSYDASYFAYTSERDTDAIVTDPEGSQRTLPSDSPDDVDPHAPSIEITESKFVGALLILQELGEYELVLKLGRPYLSTSSIAAQEHTEPDIRADIVLTVALACLELGREQWQQHQYENAAISLEAGKELLLREVLFERVRAEIQADLYKLRPYRILELLARPEDDVTERSQGLKLLQEMLDERGGIDGTGEDWSGLSLDDFLRFIQQLRSYLTAVEQQSLFAAESQRPSAVATYLQVYALVGRGFAQRMPVLIRQARLLLIRLGKRQDLSLEQGICSLLLGQTEAASRALELTQEYEPLAFIREYSQGFPDLLPGLCIYGERWLQTEVFPHFRDLATQQASLKDYFADEQVQSYLEALPMQVEATNEWVAPQSLAYTQVTRSDQISAPVSQSGSVRGQGQETSHSVHSNRATAVAATSSDATVALSDHLSGGTVVPTDRIATSAMNQKPTVAANATELTQVRTQQSRRRSRRQSARSLGVLQTGEALSYQQGNSFWTFQDILGSKKTRLFVLTGVVGIVILGFLLSQTYGWLRQTFRKEPLLQGELLVQLDRPPLSIPVPDPMLPPKELLNSEEAALVVQSWLSTKAIAFGPNHVVSRLEQILVAPALPKWQLLAQKNKVDNRYRQYKHSLRVDSVQASAAAPDRAQIQATVNEVAQLYENGLLNQDSSYNENLLVQYDLVRKNGQWRIREMKVLN